MRFSVVVVCFGHDLTGLLDDLAAQRAAGDEVIVVDNLAAEGGTPTAAHRAVDRLIEPPTNLGFGGAVNLAAAGSRREALLLLNPDTRLAAGCLDALRDAPADWSAWMGVILLPDGRINTAGNVAHFLGFGWVGGFEDSGDTLPGHPYPVGFLSGACLAIRAEAFARCGLFPEAFFLYGEDLDLSHRLRLAGEDFGVVPAARAVHDYAFEKGAYKWRYLERNRWALVLRTYPGPLLALVLPAMVLCEPPLLAVAAAQGWLRPKLASWLDLARWLPRMRAERRAIQGAARVDAATFAEGLTSALNTPLLGAVGRSPVVNGATAAYWGAVRALLRLARLPPAARAPEQR